MIVKILEKDVKYDHMHVFPKSLSGSTEKFKCKNRLNHLNCLSFTVNISQNIVFMVSSEP